MARPSYLCREQCIMPLHRVGSRPHYGVSTLNGYAVLRQYPKCTQVNEDPTLNIYNRSRFAEGVSTSRVYIVFLRISSKISLG